MPASAEEAPYELVWPRYGSVGTTDTQPGLGAVQDAVNEWLKTNGYNFTVDMMHVEDMNNLQVQMAAKEKLDIIWRNASTLSDTLIHVSSCTTSSICTRTTRGCTTASPRTSGTPCCVRTAGRCT